jgi:hypothetical protein
MTASELARTVKPPPAGTVYENLDGWSDDPANAYPGLSYWTPVPVFVADSDASLDKGGQSLPLASVTL